MSMTKKDYVTIVATIRTMMEQTTPGDKGFPERVMLRALVVNLCEKFKDGNPNFDSVRFSDACEAA